MYTDEGNYPFGKKPFQKERDPDVWPTPPSQPTRMNNRRYENQNTKQFAMGKTEVLVQNIHGI